MNQILYFIVVLCLSKFVTTSMCFLPGSTIVKLIGTVKFKNSLLISELYTSAFNILRLFSLV
jgi:hypothetical protein